MLPQSCRLIGLLFFRWMSFCFGLAKLMCKIILCKYWFSNQGKASSNNTSIIESIREHYSIWTPTQWANNKTSYQSSNHIPICWEDNDFSASITMQGMLWILWKSYSCSSIKYERMTINCCWICMRFIIGHCSVIIKGLSGKTTHPGINLKSILWILPDPLPTGQT